MMRLKERMQYACGEMLEFRGGNIIFLFFLFFWDEDMTYKFWFDVQFSEKAYYQLFPTISPFKINKTFTFILTISNLPPIYMSI